jgi:hypothetical protein
VLYASTDFRSLCIQNFNVLKSRVLRVLQYNMDGIKVESESDEMDPLYLRNKTCFNDGRLSFTFVTVNNEPQVRFQLSLM